MISFQLKSVFYFLSKMILASSSKMAIIMSGPVLVRGKADRCRLTPLSHQSVLKSLHKTSQRGRKYPSDELIRPNSSKAVKSKQSWKKRLSMLDPEHEQLYMSRVFSENQLISTLSSLLTTYKRFIFTSVIIQKSFILKEYIWNVD